MPRPHAPPQALPPPPPRHPPARLDDLDRQLGSPLFAADRALSQSPVSLNVQNQPLWEILRQLAQQQPIGIDGRPGKAPLVLSSLAASRPVVPVGDAFAVSCRLSRDDASGHCTLWLDLFCDPRAVMTRCEAVHLQHLLDGNGRSLLPAIDQNDGIPDSADPLASTAAQSVPLHFTRHDFTAVGALRGTATVALAAPEQTATLDLAHPAPILTPCWRVTAKPISGGTVNLHADPSPAIASLGPAAPSTEDLTFLVQPTFTDGTKGKALIMDQDDLSIPTAPGHSIATIAIRYIPRTYLVDVPFDFADAPAVKAQ